MSPPRRWKPNLAKIVLLALAGVLLLLALAGLGTAAWFRSYLGSSAFRELLCQHAGKALGGQAEIAPLEWEGSAVFSEKIRLIGQEGAALSTLEARQVRAAIDWRSLFNGTARIQAVEIMELEAALASRSDAPPTPDLSETPLPPRLTRLEIPEFRATRASLELGRAGALRESQLILEREDGAWAFTALGGRFLSAGYPEIRLEKLRGRFSSGQWYLTSAVGSLDNGGIIQASGEFGRKSFLRLEWSEVETDQVLPPRWQKRFQGLAAGNATTVFQKDASVTEGRVAITDGRIRDVPLLNHLATFTGSPQFRRMPVQEISADFRHELGDWDVRNFVLESKGLLRVTGGFRVARDGKLQGKFEVGVAPQVLQWIPGSRERVFTRKDQGYVWTSMLLEGSTDNPKEDLTPRLLAAARDEVTQRGAEILQKPAEAAREFLDALAPLLR